MLLNNMHCVLKSTKLWKNCCTCSKGNKIQSLHCAKGMQFYCTSLTYPIFPYCTIFSNFSSLWCMMEFLMTWKETRSRLTRYDFTCRTYIMPPCKLDFAGHEFLMVFCPWLDKIFFWNFLVSLDTRYHKYFETDWQVPNKYFKLFFQCPRKH